MLCTKSISLFQRDRYLQKRHQVYIDDLVYPHFYNLPIVRLVSGLSRPPHTRPQGYEYTSEDINRGAQIRDADFWDGREKDQDKCTG